MADNVKDQYTDEVTLNVEREVAKNLSIGGDVHLQAHRPTCSPTCPSTGRPARSGSTSAYRSTTSSGQQVMLYSVVQKDYNGDGVIDSDDIAWIGDNRHLAGSEPAGASTGSSRSATIQGLQFVLRKRYSDRWQALASFLYSNSTGIARRSLRQDFNVEGPMFWDDNWMGTLNQTINNLEGPLPFTPK